MDLRFASIGKITTGGAHSLSCDGVDACFDVTAELTGDLDGSKNCVAKNEDMIVRNAVEFPGGLG